MKIIDKHTRTLWVTERIINAAGGTFDVDRLEIIAETRAQSGPTWIVARAYAPTDGTTAQWVDFRPDSDRTPPMWVQYQVNVFLADLKKLI